MCRNVVISPVIRGPIILTIIATNPKTQNPRPKTQFVRLTRGPWIWRFGIWDLFTITDNARRRPIPVGGAVPADDPHREARGHCRAGHDARTLPPLPTHPDFRAAWMARQARLHHRARRSADGGSHRAS